MYFVPPTLTAPDPEAVHRWPCSVGSCTTIRCPTDAETESGNEATNRGEGGLVGVGELVGLRVKVGLADVGDGVADFDFLDAVGLGVCSVDDEVGELHAASTPMRPTVHSEMVQMRTARVPRLNEPVMFVSVPYIGGQFGQCRCRVSSRLGWPVGSDESEPELDVGARLGTQGRAGIQPCRARPTPLCRFLRCFIGAYTVMMTLPTLWPVSTRV